MRERFVLRDEIFGCTLFDRKLLRHEFINGHSENQLPKELEHWRAKTENLPQDILYAPIRVYFETTKVCNLSCRHCFNSSGKKGEGEMTTDEMVKSLVGMRDDHIFDVRFTGGEFTTRPDWYEVLRAGVDLGLAISVNTNGVFENQGVLDNLASLDLPQITLSIDGNRGHHDFLRGEGNFDKAITNLKALHEKGAILRTNTVVTKHSLADMQEIIELVGPFVTEMNFFYMRPIGRAKRIQSEGASFEELHQFNNLAKELIGKYPGINVMFGSQVTRANSVQLNEIGLKIGGPDGFTRFNLLADGSVWAGGYVPYIDKAFGLGNIIDENFTLLRIWRESATLKAFRDFSESLIRKCMTCQELDERCPGVNVEMELVRVKNPETGNPYCQYDSKHKNGKR